MIIRLGRLPLLPPLLLSEKEEATSRPCPGLDLDPAPALAIPTLDQDRTAHRPKQ